MKDLNANATKWLESIGYPAASLTTPMEGKVLEWWGYFMQSASFYTREEKDEHGATNKVKVRSCTPADMVCSDMAALLYNEKASISVPSGDAMAEAWLASWLDSCNWHNTAPLAMKRMCATGTAAWALHIEGANRVGQSDRLRVTPVRYDAHSIIPLRWDGVRCSDCAFIGTMWLKGRRCTQIEVHRPDSATGSYQVFCAFFDDRGEQFEPGGFLQATEALDTKQPKPTFQLIRLADDNPYWDYSPMGVSLFDKAIDAIETVDLAFDSIGNDLFLGRKMVILPENMLHRNEAGRLEIPHMNGQQFFVATESNVYDGNAAIFEYNPSLRAEENRQMLATALQVLGKRIGFGTKAYALDSTGSITTAKEVASDNAEMMRTVRRHEHVIEPAISDIIEAAANTCRTLGTASIPDMTGQVQVVMGDNIMEDDDTLRERDRADVAAGLLEPWRYMVRWQGYTEEDAKAATSASAGAPFEV